MSNSNAPLKDDNNDCIEDVVLSDVHVYKTFTKVEEGNYGMVYSIQYVVTSMIPICNRQ